MPTSTTTWAAIRRQMILTIKALSPTSLSTTRYDVADIEAGDFRTWAADNGQAAFRRYEITDGPTERPNVEDNEVQLRHTPCEVVLAYPHAYGWYRTMDANNQWNMASLRALIESDLALIEKNIGRAGAANYVAGQHAALYGSQEIERQELVSFGVLRMTCIYYHAA